MKKNKINNIVLKTFIIIAVIMMLLSMMPSEGKKVSETTIIYEGIGKWSKTN